MNLLPILLLLAFCACSGEESPGIQRGVSVFTGFSVSGTDAHAAKWRLDTPKATMEDLDSRMFFVEPVMRFYENGAITTVIKAQAGQFEPARKSAVLSTNVEVDAKKDGMLLRTDKLYYSPKKGKIWTDEKVTLLRGKTVVTGKGFTANPDLSEIEIEHQETRLQ